MIAIPVEVTVTYISEQVLILGAADMCNMPVADWLALLAEHGEAQPC